MDWGLNHSCMGLSVALGVGPGPDIHVGGPWANNLIGPFLSPSFPSLPFPFQRGSGVSSPEKFLKSEMPVDEF